MEEISRSPLLAESILRSRQIISSDKHFSFFFLNRTHPIRFSSPILSYLLDRYEIEITSIAGPFPPNQMTCTRVSRPKDKAPGIEGSTAKRSLDWIAIEPRSLPPLSSVIYIVPKKCVKTTQVYVEAGDRGYPRTGIVSRIVTIAEAVSSTFTIYLNNTRIRVYVYDRRVSAAHASTYAETVRNKLIIFIPFVWPNGRKEPRRKIVSARVNCCEQSDQTNHTRERDRERDR